ncbi:MAG: hypothetical protein ACI9FJ_001830 [Alteromonadaceae bacterium]|jgi:hypothetical protein
MQNKQNPNAKKTFKKLAAGGLSLSALTLGLWFGGVQAVSQPTVVADNADDSGSIQRADTQNSEVKGALLAMKSKPHTYSAQNIFKASNSKDFAQYAVLDNHGFQDNVFTGHVQGINDTADLTASDENTVGLARMVVLDKPGITTDPSDPRSHVGVYIDVSGLKTIKGESGWYEATLMYTTQIPPVAEARKDGHAKFGFMTPEDHAIMSAQGTGYNATIGHVFTKGGVDPRYPAKGDVWPNDVNNLVTFPVTAGTFNALQMDDAHHYFELRPETNMVFPHQEFPFAGGVPALHPPEGAYAAGTLGHFQSIVPGSGPLGINDNDPHVYGDNPDDPRDADRFSAVDRAQMEFRLRSVPSGLTEEIHRDVFIRRSSFHPEENNLQRRLYLALAYEYSLIDSNDDGVLSFEELDINGTSDGGQSNERLYFAITQFDRLVIQREINDGLVVPRFANSQRAWVVNGDMKSITGERVRDRHLAESEMN